MIESDHGEDSTFSLNEIGEAEIETLLDRVKDEALGIPLLDAGVRSQLEIARFECILLWKRSWSIILAYLLQMSLVSSNLIWVGRIGERELAGASLGSMFCNVTGYAIGFGMATALETLSSQAHTLKEQEKKRRGIDDTYIGVLLQRAIWISLLLCIPISVLWLNARPLLHLAHQDPEISRLAGRFVLFSLPSLPAMLVFECMKKFLQSQGFMSSSLFILIVAAPLNAFLGFLLIHHPPTSLGFLGAPITQSITSLLLPVLAVLYIRFINGFQGWGGFSSQSLTDWWPYLHLGLPGIAMVCAEWWAFEITGILAGLLGQTPLAVQTVLLQTTSIFFMIPFALAAAAGTRVGNLLGATRPAYARISAAVSLANGLAASILYCIALFLLRRLWAALFSQDLHLRTQVIQAIPIAAVYMVADAINAVSAGLLRGVGKQRIGSIINLAAHYLLGLPLGVALAFHWKLGVHGLLWGITAALAAVASLQLMVFAAIDWEDEARQVAHRLGVD